MIAALFGFVENLVKSRGVVLALVLKEMDSGKVRNKFSMMYSEQPKQHATCKGS